MIKLLKRSDEKKERKKKETLKAAGEKNPIM